MASCILRCSISASLSENSGTTAPAVTSFLPRVFLVAGEAVEWWLSLLPCLAVFGRAFCESKMVKCYYFDSVAGGCYCFAPEDCIRMLYLKVFEAVAEARTGDLLDLSVFVEDKTELISYVL